MRESSNHPTGNSRPGRLVVLATLLVALSAAGVTTAGTPSPPSAASTESAPLALGLDPDRLARINGLVAEAIAAGEMSGCVVAIGRRAGT
ncbi:MAG: hypothetical protein NZ658_07150, partial [Pirellulales bacterium]|nr:hypothetical protein [Pirellulales bacterium]